MIYTIEFLNWNHFFQIIAILGFLRLNITLKSIKHQSYIFLNSINNDIKHSR